MINISSNKLWTYGLLIAGLLFLSDALLGDGPRSKPFDGEVRSVTAIHAEERAAIENDTGTLDANEPDYEADADFDDGDDGIGSSPYDDGPEMDEGRSRGAPPRPARPSSSSAGSRAPGASPTDASPLFKDLKKAGF